MFQTARSTKVFQDVVAQIEEAILSGRIPAGETLPSERELKAMFGVSRPTLREALRVLEEKGLIEIRLGTGGGERRTLAVNGRELLDEATDALEAAWKDGLTCLTR